MRKTKCRAIITIIITIVLATYLSLNLKVHTWADIIPNQFLLSFFGVFLGLSITIISFIFLMVDKMRERLLNLKKTHSDKAQLCDEQLSRINSLFRELEQDTFLIFWSFVFVIIFTLADCVFTTSKIIVLCITIHHLLVAIKISLFILSLIVMYDMIKTLFLLINVETNQ